MGCMFVGKHVVAALCVLLGSIGVTAAEAPFVPERIWSRVICCEEGRYIGWPTVCRRTSGELIAVFSGDRDKHVCPWGKVQMVRSKDDGETWSAPETIVNSIPDDRDAGILELKDGTLVLKWFTSTAWMDKEWTDRLVRRKEFTLLDCYRRHYEKLPKDLLRADLGSFTSTSSDGGKTWTPRVRTLGSAPHGGVQLKDGRLMLVGRHWNGKAVELTVETSVDGAKSWQLLSTIGVPDGENIAKFCEPFLTECANGDLLAVFRHTVEPNEIRAARSTDGGRTWTKAEKTGVFGLPPHVLTLKNGIVVMTYAKRVGDFGEYVVLSFDHGRTWDVAHEYCLAPCLNYDLGYPSTVELPNGELLTVYYQPTRYKAEKKADTPCLQATKWRLVAPTAPSARANVLRRLPLGSVRPEGFLREQLRLQKEGLTGHAEELYPDIGESDWLTGGSRGGQFAWERGPYYARGLVALALALDDPELKKKSARWVEALLARQAKDGSLPMAKKRNWWANMLSLGLMRDWYEATGDVRARDFLCRYADYQLAHLAKEPLSSDSCWAVARGGDNLSVVLWLYDLTHEAKYIRLARTLERQTGVWEAFYGGRYDWTKQYAGFYPRHIVNLMQGLKTPPLRTRLTGSPEGASCWHGLLTSGNWLFDTVRRPDGMLSGSEPISDMSTTAGTELCAIAERIFSSLDATEALGDVLVADTLERVAYNALPGTLYPDGRAMRYYSLPNQVSCAHRPLGFSENGAPDEGANTPGPQAGFGCCRSNYHVAWPKFVQQLWFARPDGALVASAYGPCTLRSAGVEIAEKTGYPFADDVTFDVVAANLPVRLAVRIPGWCRSPKLTVDGKSVRCESAKGYFTLPGTLRRGSRVCLSLPDGVHAEEYGRRTKAVVRGPLVFAYPIVSRKPKSVGVPLREAKEVRDPSGAFPTRELTPAEPWNVGLQTSNGAVVGRLTRTAALPAQPFAPGAESVALEVDGFAVDGWGDMRSDFPGRAAEPPESPVKGGASELRRLRLVPYGATQLRVSLFPWR